jgi:peptidoglycan endopeptidase LytF
MYKVKKGDSIFALAKRFDTSVDEIKKTNNLKSSTLKVGQKLKLEKKAVTQDEGKQKGENSSGKKSSKGRTVKKQ